MKKVSIIIPLYNVAAFIEECCDSVLAQTYENIEVVFVDDCSTDNTMSVLSSYLSAHPSFPQTCDVAHNYNRGLSAARNSGLQAASGEYVLFLDSDDELTPDCIGALVNAIETNHCDVAMGEVEEFGENVAMLHRYPLTPGIPDDTKTAYARGEWYVMAWNKLCRREFLLIHNMWFEEGLLHEDMLWSLKLACANPRMALIDVVTYFYRIRHASIMTSMSIEKDLAVHVEVFRKMKDFVCNEGLVQDPDVYASIEGKKSQVLYSLLEGGHYRLFRQYYPHFHQTSYISPLRAWRNGLIGFSRLMRDFGYCLPASLAAHYRSLFYKIAYKWRHKKIKGALWKA